MDCIVHGILQARILEWVAFPFSRVLNPGLPHCRWILYPLSHKGSPRVLEWAAYPFSSRSSWPKNGTGVSCTVGGSFTSWATREALLQCLVPETNHDYSCTSQKGCETSSSPQNQFLSQLDFFPQTYFFLNLLIFNWRKIASQYCVGFCHTSAWISCRDACVPSLWNLPPTSPPFPTSVTEPQFEFPESYSTFPLLIYLTRGTVCVSTLFSPFVSPSLPPPSPCPWVSSLCLHLHCCPVNRFISTIFLDSIYVH